jgi:hypothetical protein
MTTIQHDRDQAIACAVLDCARYLKMIGTENIIASTDIKNQAFHDALIKIRGNKEDPSRFIYWVFYYLSRNDDIMKKTSLEKTKKIERRKMSYRKNELDNLELRVAHRCAKVNYELYMSINNT